MDTFEKKNGDKISFMDYYKTPYSIHIREGRQPLLVSLPRERDKNRPPPGAEKAEERDRHVLLIPELCMLTGIYNTEI